MNCWLWVVALVVCMLPNLAAAQTTCPFRIAADFPVTYVGYHSPVITVTIHDLPVRMEVDTGAYTSMLTTQAYNALNLHDSYNNTHGLYAKGVAGDMQINSLVMEDIRLGTTRLRDKILFISDSAAASSHGVPLVDGVIGEDILQAFDVGLDFPDNRITLYDPPGCAATQPPWAGNFAQLPMTTHKQTLVTTVDYGVDNATLAATIDSGAESSLIAQSALARAGVTPEAVQAQRVGVEGVGFNRIATAPEQFSSITIGAESFADMWVLVGQTPMAEFNDALIGEDYLATHRVFIANSSETAFFYTASPAGN